MNRHLVAAVLLAVAAAACSGGSADSDGDRSQPATDRERQQEHSTTSEGEEAGEEIGEEGEIDQEADAVAFAECMRGQGLDYPDPVLGPDGQYAFEDPDLDQVSRDELDAAMDACRDLLPPRETIDDPESLAAWIDASLEWARCMRDQGHPVPDPVLNEESEVGAVEVNPGDRGDPDFEAAAAECDEALRAAAQDIREDADAAG